MKGFMFCGSSADDATMDIRTCTDKGRLEEELEYEQSNRQRKTVIKELERRLRKLYKIDAARKIYSKEFRARVAMSRSKESHL